MNHHGGFRTTFPAYLVAGLLAAPPVLAQAPAVEAPSLPAEPPALSQRAVESTPMPAEPPKAEEPKPAAEAKPAAETPVPPPALPRVIPGPVTAAPRFNDLMTAVIYGDPNTVQQLLSLGKWPDKPDSRGVTALMIAALFGDDASAEALLKAGANPNRPGPGGDTATSIARERQETAVLQLLQRYGGK